MIGRPLAGLKMLLVDIMSTRASIWASSDSGTCTAIWSPSKSALNAAHTSGCSWMALPSMSRGSKA
jgi:protein subunit release factor B